MRLPLRFVRLGVIAAIGLGLLGVDVGESLRAGSITVASADARARASTSTRKKHHRHHRHHRKHARKRHRKHHAPPPEM
jgi:hypothetical protein